MGARSGRRKDSESNTGRVGRRVGTGDPRRVLRGQRREAELLSGLRGLGGDADRDRWVTQDENGNLLGVDRTLDSAIGSATREANLASRAGCRVIVTVVDEDAKRSRVYVAQPLNV